MKFSEFKLNETILDALFYMNFEEATEIQIKAIPYHIRWKRPDRLCADRNGKTAAFVLPTLNQIADAPSDGVQVAHFVPHT
jgi:superfamily II DNA/RNA helicase